MKKSKHFTIPCYIRKDTKELRDKLKAIGYKSIDDDVREGLVADRSGYMYSIEEDKLIDSTYNCVDNEDLFLALAALRDDTDIYQWFTDGEKWVISDIHSLLELKGYFKTIKFDYSKTHKATAEELIKHFNS